MIHPWGVPTQPKINPEAFYPGRVHVPVSLASRYTAAAVYSRAYSFFVLYTGIQRTRIVPRRLQRSTALQRYTVYSSTAVYSIQRYTFPLRGVHTAPWPDGRLELSSRAPPRSRWDWIIGRRTRTTSPHPPSPAWLLSLAKISKQASSHQQHTL